jgi:imidazoleglycerol-phosphate dehydratase/histidinol-phosphatase
LGTEAFPEETFLPVHRFIMKSLENEGIHFSRVLIDRTYPSDNASTRKPGTGMLTDYIDNTLYDIPGSFVIGDRITDVQLAKNLGCMAIWLNNDPHLGGAEVKDDRASLQQVVALETNGWKSGYDISETQKKPVYRLN